MLLGKTSMFSWSVYNVFCKHFKKYRRLNKDYCEIWNHQTFLLLSRIGFGRFIIHKTKIFCWTYRVRVQLLSLRFFFFLFFLFFFSTNHKRGRRKKCPQARGTATCYSYHRTHCGRVTKDTPWYKKEHFKYIDISTVWPLNWLFPMAILIGGPIFIL